MLKTILIWALLILMFVSIYSMCTDSSSKEKELPGGVTEFVAKIAANEENGRPIERIMVEPRGHDDARYVLTLKNTSQKEVVFAEFPGTLTETIRNAKIPYSVKSKDESSI